MSEYTFKQKIGALLIDWPRFEWNLQGIKIPFEKFGHWTFIRNRNESLKRSEKGVGVLCPWQWTSDLHVAKVFPSLGKRLMKKALNEWPVEFASKPKSNCSKDTENTQISFIIGHRGIVRLPHLLATLQSIAAQRDVTFECIVVEQASKQEIKGYLPDWVEYINTPLPHPEMPYSRSWAFNVGARSASGRILVFNDSDVCITADYGSELMKLWAQGYQSMRLQRFMFYLNKSTTKKVLKNCQLPLSVTLDSITQNFQGATIAVEKETYFRIGGHDESFVGWGGEDNEFFQRCYTTNFYPYMYLPFIHLYHEPQSSKDLNYARKASELLETRSSIPAEHRVAELTVRNFGNPEQLDPTYL